MKFLFYPILYTLFFPSHWILFQHNNLRDYGQRWERNACSCNDYQQLFVRNLPSWGSNQRPPVFKSGKVPTEPPAPGWSFKLFKCAIVSKINQRELLPQCNSHVTMYKSLIQGGERFINVLHDQGPCYHKIKSVDRPTLMAEYNNAILNAYTMYRH